MTVQPLTNQLPEALLDERAAAKFLGVSPRVLWGLADAGSIPFIRIGPRLKRYAPRDLQEFIERNRRINRPACDNAGAQDVAGR
jgi:predicted DNA-binding transcriptional regulator AlpA